jgi:hypothetical protein
MISATLYYIARGKRLRSTDVRDACDVPEGVSVYVRDQIPSRVVSDALVVWDLLESPTEAPELPRDEVREFLVATPVDTVFPDTWDGFLARPNVRVLRLPRMHVVMHPLLQSVLRLRFQLFREDWAAGVVERGGAMLEGMEDVVLAVLNDPSRICTPHDVAKALEMTTGALAERWAHLPFRQLEHVITAIRWLAFEHLINDGTMRTSTALRMVGMDDQSRFQQEVEQVQYLFG